MYQLAKPILYYLNQLPRTNINQKTIIKPLIRGVIAKAWKYHINKGRLDKSYHRIAQYKRY